MGASMRVMLAGIFLLALVVITAFAQLSYHFDTLIALAIMLVGTVLAARFLFDHQGH